jgi:transcriptional regulator with XRE-family HTH domain
MHQTRSVEELCAEHGIALAQLAERAGLEEKRVVAIASGRWTPSPSERDRIAAVFGLTREQIAWGHRNPIAHVYGHGPQFGRSP